MLSPSFLRVHNFLDIYILHLSYGISYTLIKKAPSFLLLFPYFSVMGNIWHITHPGDTQRQETHNFFVFSEYLSFIKKLLYIDNISCKIPILLEYYFVLLKYVLFPINNIFALKINHKMFISFHFSI